MNSPVGQRRTGADAPRVHPPGRPARDGLLATLWRQRNVVGIAAAACVAVAVVYLLFARPLYTSTARMSVRLGGPRAEAEARAAAAADASTGSYLYTEGQLIRSPSVLALAAQSPEVRPLVASMPDPLQFLSDGLEVDAGRHDTIVAVSFTSPDRRAAADVANAVVRAYVAYQSRPSAIHVADVGRLNDERASLEHSLSHDNEQMQVLEQTYGALGAGANAGDSLAERQFALVAQQLAAARLETLNAESDYRLAQRTVDQLKAAGDASLDDPALSTGPQDEAQLRAQMLQLQGQLADLRQRFLPNHPYVRAAQRQVNRLQVSYAGVLERRFMVARAREQDLQAQADQQQKRALEVSAKSAQYARLREDAESLRRRLEQNDIRRGQLDAAHEMGALEIDAFDPAMPPARPSRPRALATLSLSLGLGLALGCCLGLVRDRADDRFRTIEEIKDRVGLPLLGMVPLSDTTAGDGALASPLMAGRQALVAPTSGIAEACRTVRAAIQFGSPRVRSQTLLVTSPASGDGKSIVSANLAITAAQAGKRVLIVDANLRTPAQHEIFGARNHEGLSNLLEGQITLDQAVQPTNVGGLEILPAGPVHGSAAEILNSPMLAELIEVLSDRYDQIIVDSPATAGLADARIIAACCDATLLVLRANQSTRRATAIARLGLAGVGANLLGVVVNAAGEPAAASAGDRRRAAGRSRRPTRRPPAEAVADPLADTAGAGDFAEQHDPGETSDEFQDDGPDAQLAIE